MSTVALSGNDTVMINNTIIADLADGDCVDLTFPNDVANVTTGKNGNAIYGFNATGAQCEVKLRLVRGSAGDKLLNGMLQAQTQSFASTVLMIGEFIKQIGKGDGTITSDTYVMSGGIFTKNVEGKSNVTGDTAQSVAVYTMKFSNAPRALT